MQVVVAVELPQVVVQVVVAVPPLALPLLRACSQRVLVLLQVVLV